MRFLIIFLCLLPIICYGQNNKSETSNVTYRLDTKFPSAYMSFEKFGKRTPLYYPNESNEGIWLRFHNNSKWNITIKTFGVDKEYGDFGIFYEIESLLEANEAKINKEVPIGYRMKHISSVYTLQSGKNFLFSIPREHLANGLFLLVGFSYEWEQDGDAGGGGNILHQARFFSSSLPKQIR